MSIIKQLIEKYGQLYSELLGIRLNTKKESEIFKWLLASYFFGKHIQEKVAILTYNAFKKNNLLSVNKISKTSWKKLVKILGQGHYVRYDESTATRLLLLTKKLKQVYNGKITNVYKKAKNPKDLENKLKEFKGVGNVTLNIFLRELRVIWKKSNVKVSNLAQKAAKKLKIDLSKFNKKSKRFIMLETALVRISKELKRGKKWQYPMKKAKL